MTERTLKALGDELIEAMPKKTDLIYVSQGDRLTDEQVAAVVSGDTDKLWDLLSDWESDTKADAVANDIAAGAKEIVNRWEREDDEDYTELLSAFDWTCEEWDRVRDLMEERESGDWFKDLMNGCSDVLMRVEAIGEDEGWSFEPVRPEQVIEAAGIPDTEENRRILQAALAEVSPEHHVVMGYWIFGADVSEIFALPNEEDTEVEVTNPHLYLGNPFAGNGWLAEEPLQVTIRIKREALRTDADAFGYGVSEIFGGLSGSQYSSTITAVEKEQAS
jgi:hypothetical protein